MQLSGCFVCYFRHWQKLRLFIWPPARSLHFDIARMRIGETTFWFLWIFSSVWCHSILKRCVQTSIGNQWYVIMHFVFHFVQFCCVTIYCCKMVKLVAYIEMKILYCLFICMHVSGTLAIVVIRDFSLYKTSMRLQNVILGLVTLLASWSWTFGLDLALLVMFISLIPAVYCISVFIKTTNGQSATVKSLTRSQFIHLLMHVFSCFKWIT